MKSKDVLEYIINLNKYINDNSEIARMEIDIDLIHALEQIQKDLEILNIIKKRAKFEINMRFATLPPVDVWELKLTICKDEKDFKKLKEWWNNDTKEEN